FRRNYSGHRWGSDRAGDRPKRGARQTGNWRTAGGHQNRRETGHAASHARGGTYPLSWRHRRLAGVRWSPKAHHNPKFSFSFAMTAPSLSPEARMAAIDRQMAHLWMVRTFLKHAEETEEDEELQQ